MLSRAVGRAGVLGVPREARVVVDHELGTLAFSVNGGPLVDAGLGASLRLLHEGDLALVELHVGQRQELQLTNPQESESGDHYGRRLQVLEAGHDELEL